MARLHFVRLLRPVTITEGNTLRFKFDNLGRSPSLADGSILHVHRIEMRIRNMEITQAAGAGAVKGIDLASLLTSCTLQRDVHDTRTIQWSNVPARVVQLHEFWTRGGSTKHKTMPADIGASVGGAVNAVADHSISFCFDNPGLAEREIDNVFPLSAWVNGQLEVTVGTMASIWADPNLSVTGGTMDVMFVCSVRRTASVGRDLRYRMVNADTTGNVEALEFPGGVYYQIWCVTQKLANGGGESSSKYSSFEATDQTQLGHVFPSSTSAADYFEQWRQMAADYAPLDSVSPWGLNRVTALHSVPPSGNAHQDLLAIPKKWSLKITTSGATATNHSFLIATRDTPSSAEIGRAAAALGGEPDAVTATPDTATGQAVDPERARNVPKILAIPPRR